MKPFVSSSLIAAAFFALSSCGGPTDPEVARVPAGELLDTSSGRDWPAFGRTYGEQHYSPLDEVNRETVERLGLAWSVDLPLGNSVTGPIAVDGVLYTATGYSVVRAFDAATGEQLWEYDPEAPQASGRKLRQGWGSRGIAWWNGKVYTGTQDGRLIAIDAKTGKPVWSQMTVEKDDVRFISGAPRVFDGKVIIGHGGADVGSIRGYVTAYDAETGKQLWRFWTVPGQPGVDDDETTRIASETWAGEWWKHGGGGTVWNAITYDAELDTIYLGTGNGAPWNHKIRSAGEGDNLFLCAIVALDAKTGKYKWHYQINPAESWDYNASMDMQVATLEIDGKPRKVLMQAPKNGFFYVIDRTNGKLISAEPFVKVSWASKIDLKTGRPVEMPGIRYENGPATLTPTPIGAHSWTPMAYSPQTRLVYIPAIELEATFDDSGITPENWKRAPGGALDYAVRPEIRLFEGQETHSALVAVDPVTQKQAWRIPTPSHFNGGVAATGGGLVFHGQVDSRFNAYDAKTGKLLWSYDAKAPVIAPPITYMAKGRQYVTVLTGMGTSGGFLGPLLAKYGIDYRSQARRVLTFALDGKAVLPDAEPYKPVAFDDPDYRPDTAAASAGADIYNQRCVVCHGGEVVAAGVAPDLRTSPTVADRDTFDAIVRDGVLVPAGMPGFEEMTETEREALRYYLRARAADLRKETKAAVR
ncbi:PQQ-dependent dehydrogenase, methanol/ethanol family [Sphingosinicella soli]|uniref:Quinohemoprotein ethanol dehydrogenase n=1 Tax=Sphingosinicella soli TaxID=333708 RepID=A0A7W7B3I7_9SPHN|nr:PQQ-dependent dehydrogenase, methanol/ethanol family [Sphingosinicella soli]MBB4632385.1 quinohemoprotein ethanol dehydrogenase [Sphingosinicella soli]